MRTRKRNRNTTVQYSFGNGIRTQPVGYTKRKRNQSTAAARKCLQKRDRNTNTGYIFRIRNRNTTAEIHSATESEQNRRMHVRKKKVEPQQPLENTSYFVQNGIEPQSREICSEKESVYDRRICNRKRSRSSDRSQPLRRSTQSRVRPGQGSSTATRQNKKTDTQLAKKTKRPETKTNPN